MVVQTRLGMCCTFFRYSLGNNKYVRTNVGIMHFESIHLVIYFKFVLFLSFFSFFFGGRVEPL